MPYRKNTPVIYSATGPVPAHRGQTGKVTGYSKGYALVDFGDGVPAKCDPIFLYRAPAGQQAPADPDFAEVAPAANLASPSLPDLFSGIRFLADVAERPKPSPLDHSRGMALVRLALSISGDTAVTDAIARAIRHVEPYTLIDVPAGDSDEADKREMLQLLADLRHAYVAITGRGVPAPAPREGWQYVVVYEDRARGPQTTIESSLDRVRARFFDGDASGCTSDYTFDEDGTDVATWGDVHAWLTEPGRGFEVILYDSDGEKITISAVRTPEAR